MSEQQSALIVGAGPGLGGALCRRFAREGFAVCGVRRRHGAASTARELAPEGVHVAHVLIDGAIDMPWIRENFGEGLKERGPDALLAPDDIAQSYWAIHNQPRSAWTFEMDLRPWVENW